MYSLLRIVTLLSGAVLFFPACADDWKSADPNTPEIHQKAVRALKEKQIFPITSQIFPITDASSHPITANIQDIQASAADISKAMQEIGATKTDQGYEINLNTDILFDFDKYNIKPEAQTMLKKVSVILHDKSITSIHISGHTDSKGSDSYNQKLSERRAQAVAAWLLQRGKLNQGMFHITGYGKTKPLVPNQNPDGSDNPDNRAKNRRVEILAATTASKN